VRILFIGDVFGEPGLKIINEHLAELKKIHRPNLVIINAENAANGRGINLKIYKELMSQGVHGITMGNWTWGNKDLFNFIEDSNVVRPINFCEAPGKGFLTINYNGQKVLIINAVGRTSMNPNVSNPFTVLEALIEKEEADYIFIDFHAEATSEKVALGHYLDGKVDAIVGTHTHVQTADERILPKGTLYITDVGMTGPLNGIIGVKQEVVLDRFLKGFSQPNEVAQGVRQLNAVILDLDKKSIKRIHIESDELM